REYHIDQGNEHHDQPPAGLAHDLQQDPKRINRDNACPAGLTGLLIDLPLGNDQQDREYEATDPKRNKCGKEIVLVHGSGFYVAQYKKISFECNTYFYRNHNGTWKTNFKRRLNGP